MRQGPYWRRAGTPIYDFCSLASEKRIFRARDIEALGWSRGWLRLYTGIRWLKQHGRGRYGLAQIDGPSWGIHAEAALRFPHHVFCLTSALWMYGLLKEEPAEAWLLLGKSAHRPSVTDVAIRFARMRVPLPPEELRRGTVEGVPFRTPTLDRTLVDCLRLPALVQPPQALQALQVALARGRTTPERLTSMATRLRAAGRLRRALQAVAPARPGDGTAAREESPSPGP